MSVCHLQGIHADIRPVLGNLFLPSCILHRNLVENFRKIIYGLSPSECSIRRSLGLESRGLGPGPAAALGCSSGPGTAPGPGFSSGLAGAGSSSGTAGPGCSSEAAEPS